MIDYTARFLDIQRAAGRSEPVEKEESGWSRDEILACLDRGATTDALRLSLQAIGSLTNDPSFWIEAGGKIAPAKPGEAWRRAYKVYSLHAQKIREAGSALDHDAAAEEFSAAATDTCQIYTLDSDETEIAQELASAVYNALNRIYETSSAEARKNGSFDWDAVI